VTPGESTRRRHYAAMLRERCPRLPGPSVASDPRPDQPVFLQPEVGTASDTLWRGFCPSGMGTWVGTVTVFSGWKARSCWVSSVTTPGTGGYKVGTGGPSPHGRATSSPPPTENSRFRPFFWSPRPGYATRLRLTPALDRGLAGDAIALGQGLIAELRAFPGPRRVFPGPLHLAPVDRHLLGQHLRAAIGDDDGDLTRTHQRQNRRLAALPPKTHILARRRAQRRCGRHVRADLGVACRGRAGLSSTSPSAGRPRGLGRPIRHRLPPGDDPHALARLGVVGDEREVPAELDDAGQLTTLVIGAADGFSGDLVHGEHAASRSHGGGQREDGPGRPQEGAGGCRAAEGRRCGTRPA
jgi:hypothetical protein